MKVAHLGDKVVLYLQDEAWIVYQNRAQKLLVH